MTAVPTAPAAPPKHAADGTRVALAPPLLGLFQALVDDGLPLGLRDYLDGLRALQLGFGVGPDPTLPAAAAGGVGFEPAASHPWTNGRQHLLGLAQALWARSDAERRLVARWFDELPPVLDMAEADPREGDSGTAHRPPASPTKTQPTGQDGQPWADELSPELGPGQAGDDDAATNARISFTAGGNGGLPVPRLPLSLPITEAYVLRPHTPLSQRELAVLWRRLRRSARSGPRTELDVAATIAERCRTGLLRQPVQRARRGNCARLLVLVDSSPSMDPWQSLADSMARSLQLGRLASAQLYYFNNLPRRQVWATPDGQGAEPLDALLRQQAGAGLMIVSDAGAARGQLNRRRAVQTLDWLQQANLHCPAMVWVNPMPAARWAGTSAGLIAAQGRAGMLPLDAAHLLQAVDRLRGLR